MEFHKLSDSPTLWVEVVEARDLRVMDLKLFGGKSDPYCTLCLEFDRKEEVGTPVKRVERGSSVKFVDPSQMFRTSLVLKNINPTWGEEFVFVVDPDALENTNLLIELFDWDKLSKDDFMGSVRIPLSMEDVRNERVVNQWFDIVEGTEDVEHVLSPPPMSSSSSSLSLSSLSASIPPSSSSQGYGSVHLRLQLSYSRRSVVERLFDLVPRDRYALLEELFIWKMPLEKVIELLRKGNPRAIGAWISLLMADLQKLEHVVQHVIEAEIEGNKHFETLFRSNSAASRMIVELLKTQGKDYLRECLGEPVHSILSDSDSGCMTSSSSSACLDEESQSDVLKNCSQILHSIFESEARVPLFLRFVCNVIFNAVASKFSSERAIQIVGGLFFLRFLCPALIAPHLHGVTECAPRVSQTVHLTYIAKVVQNISNQVVFGEKETLMMFANPIVEENMKHLSSFLSHISCDPVKIAGPGTSLEEDDKVLALYDLHNHLFRVYEKEISPKKKLARRKKHRMTLNSSMVIFAENMLVWKKKFMRYHWKSQRFTLNRRGRLLIFSTRKRDRLKRSIEIVGARIERKDHNGRDALCLSTVSDTMIVSSNTPDLMDDLIEAVEEVKGISVLSRGLSQGFISCMNPLSEVAGAAVDTTTRLKRLVELLGPPPLLGSTQ
eukprot:TRINITY_DN13604_c0_g1_i1.p1 TRINITY_DN13604_c0_g1~~TRINITY_DN13604_c0_g1_i1.p1  ORF type:complete len:681 (-),score=165.84 TRINITY_DN13604_c0_g1_i1:86-2080(-)